MYLGVKCLENKRYYFTCILLYLTLQRAWRCRIIMIWNEYMREKCLDSGCFLSVVFRCLQFQGLYYSCLGGSLQTSGCIFNAKTRWKDNVVSSQLIVMKTIYFVRFSFRWMLLAENLLGCVDVATRYCMYMPYGRWRWLVIWGELRI